jgi:hypothetical protein
MCARTLTVGEKMWYLQREGGGDEGRGSEGGGFRDDACVGLYMLYMFYI